MPTEHFEKLKTERKNNIIRALTRQFATRDYPEISVKELADEACISRGSFYLYFSGKEDAFLTSVKSYTARLETDLLNIYQNSQDVEAVVMEVFDYLTHLSAFEHSFFEKISNNLSLGIPDLIAETFAQFGDKLHEILNQRVAQAGVTITPEITEEVTIRREILFSTVLCSLINIGIRRNDLDEERKALRKKVNLIITFTDRQLQIHQKGE